MTFKIYTLGCKVNTYESNVINDELINNGFIETEGVADISIINTCTVTNTANNKSLKMIRHARSENKNGIVIVIGCSSQIFYEDISKMGVEIILGNVGKSKIADYINEYLKTKKQIIDIKNILDKPKFENMTLNNFDKTRAFVKIQDGCNNFCSYCIIPYTRGNVRSRDAKDILKEIEKLVACGHKEIVLTGIHTGHYGAEFKNYDLADLIKDINEVKGLERLRISSIEITELNDKMLECLKKYPLLVDHLHIPLQSGCDKILKLMNRKYDMDYFINKVKEIRKIRKDISITTDVIVGFPNETEEDFNTTLDNIIKIKFAKIHVFPYSNRNNTVASTMSNQVKEEIKKKRAHILLELSKKLEIDYMEKFINQEVEILPEVIKDGYTIGHTGNYLLVKTVKNVNKVVIKKVEYPYCIG